MELWQPLVDEIARLQGMIGEVNRRLDAMHRHGTVKQVDAEKHRIRLETGVDENGASVLTDWIPYAQWAGAMKEHWTPSVDQQMTVVSPNGAHDAMSYALPLTWSDANPSPSTSADEGVQTFGDVRTVTKKDSHLREVGETKVESTKDTITLEAPTLILRSRRIKFERLA